MNSSVNQGMLLLSYLNNIEQQNHILINILETMNRQNLSSRQLINSFTNPLAPRYRQNNFNRNWGNTIVPPFNRNNVRRESRNSRNRSNRTFRNVNRNNRNRTAQTTQTNIQTNDQTNINQPNAFLQSLLGFLSPVRVPPSQQQINNATSTFIYTTDMSPATCPIDRESIQSGDEVIKITHCGHIFRSQNLRRWFGTNARCPLCRYDIRTYSNTDLSNNTTDVSNNTTDVSNNITDISNNTTDVRNNAINNNSNILPIMHNIQTSFLMDNSFNNLANMFNSTNINSNEANDFFSSLVSNLGQQALNSLDSINLDISGNTASFTLGNIFSLPRDDVD